MNQYEKWLTRVTGFAFICGPVLFILASAVERLQFRWVTFLELYPCQTPA